MILWFNKKIPKLSDLQIDTVVWVSQDTNKKRNHKPCTLPIKRENTNKHDDTWSHLDPTGKFTNTRHDTPMEFPNQMVFSRTRSGPKYSTTKGCILIVQTQFMIVFIPLTVNTSDHFMMTLSTWFSFKFIVRLLPWLENYLEESDLGLFVYFLHTSRFSPFFIFLEIKTTQTWRDSMNNKPRCTIPHLGNRTQNSQKDLPKNLTLNIVTTPRGPSPQ